ncbi:MAG: hypothetical protein K2M46_05445 [Lachnospiraceae bacterium]|nr:hypothetical protein [Lachnospiraceae bacterium]
MPGKHKNQTIAFRPSDWQRALIEEWVAMSGYHKKDFIARSCIYSNIVVVGSQVNIKRIVDALQEMQCTMKEIVRQLQSGDFSLSEDTYKEMKQDYLAMAITVVDIVNGAAYLFDKIPDTDNQHWKADLELEQFRNMLNLKNLVEDG